MEELDYWRLCDELNIVQAALLIVGEAPNCAEYVEQWEVDKRPVGYEAAKTAITHALLNFVEYESRLRMFEGSNSDADSDSFAPPEALHGQTIEGKLVPVFEVDINGNESNAIEGTADSYRSTVSVGALKHWLRNRGFKSGFFFPEPVETLDFMDPSNTRYAPKLAAAVKAWQAVTDAGKKSPKQALDKWLREHAAEFGLTNEEGNPVEQAIEECSKVANWSPKGGATKTPT